MCPIMLNQRQLRTGVPASHLFHCCHTVCLTDCLLLHDVTLQHLPPEAPQMFVTLNPPHPPAASKTIRRLQLAHPVYRYIGLLRVSNSCTGLAQYVGHCTGACVGA